VIYHWRPDERVLYMLFAYGKTAQEDLTTDQLRVLARIVRREFK
jgi:hypothetical protein